MPQTHRSSATRYARALLEVAVRESDPVRAEQDLATFDRLMREHAELAQALTSPRVTAAARVGVVKALADRIGMVPPTAKLMALLAERGRLEIVPDLLEVYRERLLAHQNVLRAEVTSAAPLARDVTDALQSRLSGVTGKRIQLTATVDPSLVGGLVARIGSTVYDGSVRTQLARLRKQLVDNG
ncbi:MAG: ATP synthase F1 subunit delta [Acidobacteriota bacterium]